MADLRDKTMNDEFATPELAILVAIELGGSCHLDRDYADIVNHGYVAVTKDGYVMVLRRVELHYEWQMPL